MGWKWRRGFCVLEEWAVEMDEEELEEHAEGFVSGSPL